MPDNIKALPTREAIKRLRQERLENGLMFPLNATSVGLDEPIEVRIRRITTIDNAVLDQLPKDLKVVLYEGIEEFQKEMKKAENAAEPTNLEEMMANNGKIVKAAKAWAKAAFIHPRLVDTEAEITDENTWTVEDVEAEDLVAILMLSLNADSDQIKKLKLFRPAGRPAVANSENLPVAQDSVRLLESAGAGVHGDGV